MTRSSLRIRLLPLAAALCAALSLACFAVPLYVIQPFRHQGATELAIALFVTRVGPWLSLFFTAAALVLAVFTWSRMRGWIARVAVVLAVVAAASGAWLSRFNVYEQMFHPLGVPRFEVADRATLAPDDMVIAIRVDGTRRAYPIREIAYHHVVNDTVAGQPVVATY